MSSQAEIVKMRRVALALVKANIVDRVPNTMSGRSSDGMRWEVWRETPTQYWELPDLADPGTIGVLLGVLMERCEFLSIERYSDGGCVISWDPLRGAEYVGETASGDTLGEAVGNALLALEGEGEERDEY